MCAACAAARRSGRRRDGPPGRLYCALLRKPRNLFVLCAAWGKFTLKQKQFGDVESAQAPFTFSIDSRLECRLRSWNFEPGECQVRGKRAGFAGKAQLFHKVFNSFRELRQGRRRLEPCPEHARAVRVRKKPEAFDLDRKIFKTLKRPKRLSYFPDLLVRNIAQKFQGQVNPFWPGPAKLLLTARGTNGTEGGLLLGKCDPDGSREVDGDKGAHSEISNLKSQI